MQLTSSARLYLTVGARSATSYNPFATSTWYNIMLFTTVVSQTSTSSLVAFSWGMFAAVPLSYELANSPFTSGSTNTLVSSDVTRVGGFIGSMQDFKLISPTSTNINFSGQYTFFTLFWAYYLGQTCLSTNLIELGVDVPTFVLTPLSCGPGTYQRSSCLSRKV